MSISFWISFFITLTYILDMDPKSKSWQYCGNSISFYLWSVYKKPCITLFLKSWNTMQMFWLLIVQESSLFNSFKISFNHPYILSVNYFSVFCLVSQFFFTSGNIRSKQFNVHILYGICYQLLTFAVWILNQSPMLSNIIISTYANM